MPVTLPRQVRGTASGWRLTDYVTIGGRSDPAADGRAAVELDQLRDDELLLVDHAVVACSSTTPTAVRWYTDTENPLKLLDGSASGNFDVADWPAGLQLAPSTTLLVVWTGASAGAVGVVSAQARVLRRG